MRVQLLSLRHFSRPGGATTYCVNVAETFNSSGHQAQGLCPALNGEAEGQRRGLLFRTHPQPAPRKVLWRMPMLGYAQRFVPTVRDYCADSDLLISFSLPYVLAAKRAFPHKPVFYACGGIQSLVTGFARRKTISPRAVRWLNRRLLYRMERAALLQADAVLCLSESYRQKMVDWFNMQPAHWHVCPYGAEDFSKRVTENRESIRRTLGLPEQAFVVVNVSVLTNRKNTAALLDALALCRSRHVYLLVVGEGPERRTLEQRAVELGVAGRVRFTGFAQDPAPYYCASDVLAHASPHEPFGLVYLEAMTCGLPVLGPTNEGRHGYSVVHELIVDGESGHLFHPERPADLACRIDHLASDPNLAKRMGCNARKRAMEKFSWDEHVRTVINIAHGLKAGIQ